MIKQENLNHLKLLVEDGAALNGEAALKLIAEVERLKANSVARENEWCDAVQALRTAVMEKEPEAGAYFYGQLLATATRLIAER